MATYFSARFLEDRASGRTRVLDAGCGTGREALYLALKHPGSSVHGYDASATDITIANALRQKRGVQNASFSVALHDDFEPPAPFDFISTNGSILGEDEQDTFYRSERHDLAYALMQRRMARFSDMLDPHGMYVLVWPVPEGVVPPGFLEMADACGLRFVDAAFGFVRGPAIEYRRTTVRRYYELAASFEKR